MTCSDNDIISAVDYMLDESLSRSQKIELARGYPQKSQRTGAQVYQTSCRACHSKGQSETPDQANTPKIGDQGVWQALINQSMDVLIQNTLNGSLHPEHAGCPKCTSKEVIRAIQYILQESKVQGNYSLW